MRSAGGGLLPTLIAPPAGLKLSSAGIVGVLDDALLVSAVSSTLISLPKKTHNAVYHYSSGSPADHPYDDLSALLRQVLSTDK